MLSVSLFISFGVMALSGMAIMGVAFTQPEFIESYAIMGLGSLIFYFGFVGIVWAMFGKK